MKNFLKYITIAKITLDFIIVFLFFFLSKELRLLTDLIPSVSLPVRTISNLNLFYYAIIWAILLVLVFSIHWLYKIERNQSKAKETSSILHYGIYSFIFFSVMVYLWKWFIFEKEIPRLIVAFTFVFSIVSILFTRFILNNLEYFLFKNDFLQKEKVIIFTNNLWKDFLKLFDNFKKSNYYHILWVVTSKKVENDDDIKIFSLKQAEKLVSTRQLDTVLYIWSDLDKTKLYNFWELTRIFWVKYRYILNRFDLTKQETETIFMDSLLVMEIKNTALSNWNGILKRFFDIVFSIFAIIIFSPIFIIISILIKLEDSSWPVIFKNRRIWRDGQEFDLYKFRYMKWKFCVKESYEVTETEKKAALEYEQSLIQKSSTRTWPLYKIQNDPRKTKIWAFIEKYSIDELPQLFNVFLWNMSLVWPRPHQPREVEKYDIEYMRLLTIKPGITGMAQVNGREQNSFEDEYKLDLYYIENRSLILDLKIVLKTFFVVLLRAFIK